MYELGWKTSTSNTYDNIKIQIVKNYLKDPKNFFTDLFVSKIKSSSLLVVKKIYREQFEEACLDFLHNYGGITIDNVDDFSKKLNDKFKKEIAKIKKQEEVKRTALNTLFPLFLEKHLEELQKAYTGVVGVIQNGEAIIFRDISFMFEFNSNCEAVRTNWGTLNYIFNSKYKQIINDYFYFDDAFNTPFSEKIQVPSRYTSTTILKAIANHVEVPLNLFSPEGLTSLL